LAFEYWAGMILIADIGFLTPVSVFNVPDIKLPMHVGETSEMACAKVSEARRHVRCLYGRTAIHKSAARPTYQAQFHEI
jgi:hypothetical protein